MIQMTHEFHFRCVPTELFTALTDPSFKSRWDTEVIKERVEPRMQVGAMVHQQRRFMGCTVSGVSVVRELVDGEYLEIASLPGERFAICGTYRVESTLEGSVLIHEFSLSGLPSWIEPIARLGLNRSLCSRFARLAIVLEGKT